MARNKTTRGQKQRVTERSRISGLKRLKSAGLYSGSTERVTSAGARALRKYGDVAAGRAKAVKTFSRKHAESYREQYRVHGKTIIVPREKGERVYLRKSTGEIFTRRRDDQGRSVVRRIMPDTVSIIAQGQEILKPGERWAVPLGPPGVYRYFSSTAEMKEYMKKYETQRVVPGKRGMRLTSGYPNWAKYAEIEQWEE